MTNVSFGYRNSVKIVLFSIFLFIHTLSQTIMAFDLQNFSKNSFLFGAQMYKHLPDPDKNLIYSPFSIQTCLTMAFLGASGKTAEEMATVMCYLGNSNYALSEQFETVIKQLEKEDGLRIANKIYVKNSYNLKPDYSNLIEKHFKSTVQPINFGDSVAAASTINSWVEEKTNNRIKDLICADTLNDLTRAVLVNAIYFKGKWKHPFDPMYTQPMPFWTTPEESINVDMMNIKKNFRYCELPEYDATALELPYIESNLTMLIILPNKKDGLKSLESRIHEISLAVLESKLRNVEVEVFLPKFEFEYQVNLNEILKAMGIKEAFVQGCANFSGILDTPEALHISDVVHKAFIKIDEEGAEAAAATGLLITNMCLSLDDPITFSVSRPFTGFLRFGQTNLLSFFVRNV